MAPLALGYRPIRRIIRQQTKAVLVANGIQPSTKQGNRELNVALSRLAMQPYPDLDAAAQVGQALGQKIVDLSRAQNKTNLDAGIIRQMVLSGEIPRVTKTVQKPAKSSPVVVSAPQSKAAPTPAAPDPVTVQLAPPSEAPAIDDPADVTPAPVDTPDLAAAVVAAAPEESTESETVVEAEALTAVSVEPTEPELFGDVAEEEGAFEGDGESFPAATELIDPEAEAGDQAAAALVEPDASAATDEADLESEPEAAVAEDEADLESESETSVVEDSADLESEPETSGEVEAAEAEPAAVIAMNDGN